jgi:hypothetical protein
MRNPMSIEALAAWLETKDQKETYNYGDTHNCLICQYFNSIGLTFKSVGGSSWADNTGNFYDLSKEFRRVANGTSGQQTFGHALERARSFL